MTPAAGPRNDAPQRPDFSGAASGIITQALADQTLVAELRELAGFFFPRPAGHYVALEPQAFRAIILAAQEEVNRRDIPRRLAGDRRATICRVLKTDRPMIQTNAYLRATRPQVAGVQENIGWHRESFYGPDMEQSVNVWLPVANVTAENAVNYIPDSHLIPDAAIETSSAADTSVERFSVGHRIGLLYAPKQIVSGVDLANPRPLVVLPGEVAIFAGALIHGAAANRSQNIRFSVDFRMVAHESLSTSKDHFASGRAYFEPL